MLLGFTVVAEWEFYDNAKNNASEEAALLVPLYRQTRVMDQEKGDEMRHLIRSYAEHVVHGWEAFSHGERNTAAGADTNEIIRVFSSMTPANKSRELVSGRLSALRQDRTRSACKLWISRKAGTRPPNGSTKIVESAP